MEKRKELIYGSIIFLLFFGLSKEAVCNRVRKKILGQVKKWLAINGKNNPDISHNDYVKLVRDSGDLISKVRDNMTLSEVTTKFNFINPASFLATLLKKVPELDVLGIDKEWVETLEECYSDSTLNFATLMFVNRLIPIVNEYDEKFNVKVVEIDTTPIKIKVNGFKIKVRRLGSNEIINKRTMRTSNDHYNEPLKNGAVDDVGYRLFKTEYVGDAVSNHPNHTYYEVLTSWFDMDVVK